MITRVSNCSEEDEFDYYDLSQEISEEEYVVRSIVAQAVMAKVAGSTKFNIAVTPTRRVRQQQCGMGP